MQVDTYIATYIYADRDIHTYISIFPCVSSSHTYIFIYRYIYTYIHICLSIYPYVSSSHSLFLWFNLNT